jgi:uroporphyrinogen decarboxylase
MQTLMKREEGQKAGTLARCVRSEEDVRSLTLAEKETMIRRFNERIDAAVSDRPPKKQWVKNALSRGGASRCPCRFRRLSLDIILRYGDALADLFSQYPDDAVFASPYEMSIGYQRPDSPSRINTVRVLTEDARWTDEWGTEWGHAQRSVGASPVSHPLQDWSQLDDYLAHRLPDPCAPCRLDGAVPTLRLHATSTYIGGFIHLTLFERFYMLRGMENALADFHLYPNEAHRLLDSLTDYVVELVRSWGEIGGLDALCFTDDLGTQRSLMMGPELWRKFFPARYRRIFDEVHRHGMQVILHSCGNIMAIIGDLIDVGVDVLDPLQPEAMDLALVAREFGGKVAFSGGISDQRLVALSPQEVKDHVRWTIDTLGNQFDNAYLVSTSNMMPPDIPLVNLEALFEAAHNP